MTSAQAPPPKQPAPPAHPAPVIGEDGTAARIARVKAKLESPGAPNAIVSVLIYGRTKSGKTTMLSTMPGRGLVIDVRRKEGGTNVLRPWADRIGVYPIHHWQELDDVIAYLQDPASKYDWVALDTITGLLALAEEATIGRLRSLSAIPRTLKGNEWGVMGGRIIRFLDFLHELKIHSIVLAQEKRREVPDLGNTVGPDVIPMLLTPLTEPMHIIGHLKLSNIGDQTTQVMEHQLRVKGHPNYYTGMRVDPEKAELLPDVIKDPNLKRLISFYLGKGEPPEAATIPVQTGGLELSTTEE